MWFSLIPGTLYIAHNSQNAWFRGFAREEDHGRPHDQGPFESLIQRESHFITQWNTPKCPGLLME